MLLSLKNRVNLNQTQMKPRSENKTSFKGSSPHVAQLPKHLQEVRQTTIQEAIDFITSRAFFEEKIEGKNWKNHTYLAKMTDVTYSLPAKVLSRHIHRLDSPNFYSGISRTINSSGPSNATLAQDKSLKN